MKRLALLLILAASPAAAKDHYIGRATFGCREEATFTRILRVGLKDPAGADAIFATALRSGECRTWEEGQKLRLERGGLALSCVAAFGTAEPCFWTDTGATKYR